MPNPGVTASFRSGRISPNNRPFWRGGDRGFGISAPVVGLVAWGGVGPEVRGLDILLANDCELAGDWSSAASFGRWVVLRAPELLLVSRPVSRSRAAVVLGAPWDVAPLPALGGLDLTVLEAVSRADALGVGFRVVGADCDADWSNFFLRSLTLGGTVAAPAAGAAP